MLTDSFGRIHDYLRISLTESCNLRCLYCMPENYVFPEALPPRYMNADEILALVDVFVKLGVNKIRLTGGEPLVRKDAGNIINRLAALESEIQPKLTITTNGILVHQHIDAFKKAKIHSINLSLDTLKPERFLAITKRDYFHKVETNMQLLLKENFHVKLNVVVMKGINDDEIIDFIELTRNQPLHVRFIEFMPFSGNAWNQDKLLPFKEIMDQLEPRYPIVPLENEKHDTARKFKVSGFEGTFAFINTMSEPFCSNCNRLRLTADGKLKNCLFSKGETDLLTPLRNGQNVEALIVDTLNRKHEKWGGQELFSPTENRTMIAIGG